MKTIILAHFYTSPEVQALADFVGDSLDLAKYAQEQKADRIVFAGVRFMAETAKLLNPNAEVLLPSSTSTCSLVDNPNEKQLNEFIGTLYDDFPNVEIVSYINSSLQVKAYSDIIVTSRNVEEIIQSRIDSGLQVFFTPDRNMGAYLKYNNPQWGHNFNYWEDAVCEVHDKFKDDEIASAMKGWTDGKKYLIAHPEAPLPVLKRADLVGSTSVMLEYVRNFTGSIGTIFVATEDGLLNNMRDIRPDLDIRLAPMYTGCQCNSCPYMKANTPENVLDISNAEVIEIPEQLAIDALRPIEAMLRFK